MAVEEMRFGDAILQTALITVYGNPVLGFEMPKTKTLYGGDDEIGFARIRAWRFGTLKCFQLPSPVILAVVGKPQELTDEECGFKPGTVLKWHLPPDARTVALEATHGMVGDVLESSATRGVDGGVSIENPHAEGSKLCATVHIWAKITFLGQTAKFDTRIPVCIDIGSPCIPVWDVGWANLQICYKVPNQICAKLCVGKWGFEKCWEQCVAAHLAASYGLKRCDCPAPATTPNDRDNFISDEDFACNRTDVRVAGRDGDVVIRRGQTSSPIYIRSRKIIWYCEEGGSSDMQDWSAPNDTSYIIVSRGGSGGHGKVSYYR